MDFSPIINKYLTDDRTILYASKRTYIKPGTRTKNGGIFIGIDEVRQPLVNILTESLSPHGFTWKKSKRQFERKTKVGVDRIELQSIDYEHYNICFWFSKRIDEIEKRSSIICFNTGLNDILDYKIKNTISCGFNEYYGEDTANYGISCRSFHDIKAPISNVLTFIHDKILPSFDEVNELEKLHWAFNYPEKMQHNTFARRTHKIEETDYIDNNDIINGLTTADRYSYDELLKFAKYYPQYELFEHPSGKTLTQLVCHGLAMLEK